MYEDHKSKNAVAANKPTSQPGAEEVAAAAAGSAPSAKEDKENHLEEPI